MMSLFILILPLNAILVVMPLSSAFAYLGEILAYRLYKELMIKSSHLDQIQYPF
ncbi:hypothetical protein ACQV2W_05475 [Facklamia sp. P12934]|uniref:hypothetical protein n=1 Tax=Facklamia sp. P13069 TaxID=3421954 RepID=UPI003D1693FF